MRISALLLAAAALACSQKAPFAAPALDDAPEIALAAAADIPVRIPAYGLVLKNGEFEVNIEAGDAGLLRVGQSAVVFAAPGTPAVAARVTRVLAKASAETGQALAWLTPTESGRGAANDFVSAGIVVSVKRRALSVPKPALLIIGGKTVVVRAETAAGGKTAYVPVEVRLGVESDSAVEVLSGLKAGDRVVTRGALGYAYPDFKSAAGD